MLPPDKDCFIANSLRASVSKIPRLLRESGCRQSNEPADENDTISVDAVHVPSGASTRIAYGQVKIVGTGSFGVVYVVTLLSDETAREVAIKKVLQDERYKNRELQILKDLRHPNIVPLYFFFYSSSSSKPGETYLNLVQEFVPQTLSRLIKHYYRIRQIIPLAYVKLYSFQLLRGLAYLHSRAICHRDIKPQNLLINPDQGVLKICDFGSAKLLSPREPNVSYICSRYYRAPELIFGATHYTVLIDMWSAGCVIGELLLGRPVFPGGTGVDQLVEIIKVLGTPTPEEVLEMNPQYTEFKFPNIAGCPWEKLIRHRTTDSAFSVLHKLLVFSPKQRTSAADILVDSFFSDLLFPPPGHPPNATGHLPSGKPAPQFPAEFTESELEYLPSDLVSKIRSCQRAVVEAELLQNSSVSDSLSALPDDAPTPTGTRDIRVRTHAHDTTISSTSSRHRPISAAQPHPPSAIRSGVSRTRSMMTASVSDVRPSGLTIRSKESHDPQSTSKRRTDRSLSQQQLSQQHAGSAVPRDTTDPSSSRRASRIRNTHNRHSVYNCSTTKP